MIRFFLSFLIFILFPLTTSAYSLVTKTVGGHRVRVFHVALGDTHRVVAVASNTGASLESLVKSVGGVAGINGAYFSPRDYTGLPDTTNTVRIMKGDSASYSKYFPDTGINGIFGWLPSGRPILVQNNIYGERSLRDNYNSEKILELESGIANFPILLASGANLLPRYDKAGLITMKMKEQGTKSWICLSVKGDVKMGTVEKISMMDVPVYIKRYFGCVDAINLDNGGSLGIYDKSKYIVRPGRNIMDAFVIVKK